MKKKLSTFLCVCFIIVFILSSTSTVFAAGEKLSFTCSDYLYGFWSTNSVAQKNDQCLWTKVTQYYFKVGNVKTYGYANLTPTVGKTLTSASYFPNGFGLMEGDIVEFPLYQRSSVAQIHMRVDAIQGYSYGKSNYITGNCILYAG